MAVANGLVWLARQQKEDGHWEFDGSSRDHVAATGMALLPFLASGETHKGNRPYQKTVENGLNWLLHASRRRRVTDEKTVTYFGTENMYAHALATTALCEAAARTMDPPVKMKAKEAIEFILHAQGRNGSWGYQGPTPTEGDTSIVGWQIQALVAAKRADIKIENEEAVFDRANQFLESVSTDGGAKYGYRERGASKTLTPEGLLSRNLMGKLSVLHPAFQRGVEFILENPPEKKEYDTYHWFFATSVAFLHGGDEWKNSWNPRMRDLLIELQDKSEGELKGSWPKDGGFIGTSCGRIGTTALAMLTLEVYYRHAPLPDFSGRLREMKD